MILTILKVIGIILLVILSLIIVILAVVLLTPVKYNFDAEYYDAPDVLAVVRFLPVGLKAQVSFKENALKYTVRALGGVIMTNTDEKLSWLGRKIAGDGKKVDASGTEHNSNVQVEENAISPKVEDDTGDMIIADDTTDTADIKNETESTEPIDSTDSKKTKKLKKPKDKRPFSEKFAEKKENIKNKYIEIKAKLKKLNKKKDALENVLKSERFEFAKKDVFRYIKEILKVLKPKSIKGRIHFGLNDPATTGEITGVLATFLPIYDGNIDIRPDFEKQIIEGNLKGYGKIRLISFIKVGIKVIFNRNLMKVIKRVQIILEA